MNDEIETTIQDAPFELPAQDEVNANGNTPAQQKAADIAAEKPKKGRKAKAAATVEAGAEPTEPKAPKEPKVEVEPKLTVKEVVLAGLALSEAGLSVSDSDDTVLVTTGSEGSTPITAKVIINRLAKLVPGNNCTSIAWYKNALKVAKGATTPRISFLDTDGSVELATKVWVEGIIPPKVARKNAPQVKKATQAEDNAAYAAAMDEWARQNGINVDAPGGYCLSPDQVVAFEAQYVA